MLRYSALASAHLIPGAADRIFKLLPGALVLIFPGTPRVRLHFVPVGMSVALVARQIGSVTIRRARSLQWVRSAGLLRILQLVDAKPVCRGTARRIRPAPSGSTFTCVLRTVSVIDSVRSRVSRPIMTSSTTRRRFEITGSSTGFVDFDGALLKGLEVGLRSLAVHRTPFDAHSLFTQLDLFLNWFFHDQAVHPDSASAYLPLPDVQLLLHHGNGHSVKHTLPGGDRFGRRSRWLPRPGPPRRVPRNGASRPPRCARDRPALQ